MKITSATVGPFEENSYLLVDEDSQRAVFVDPGDEGERLLDMLARSGATLEGIWLTHGHVDHVGGIAALKRKHAGVPVHLHPADRLVYASGSAVAARYGFPFDEPPPPDRELGDGQILTIGKSAFTVMHVPGHAPGHVLFVGDEVILGGDLIFAGSIGRTDLPGSDPRAMQQSLARAAGLPERLALYPGHGPATTIQRELESNPFLNGMARVLSGRSS